MPDHPVQLLHEINLEELPLGYSALAESQMSDEDVEGASDDQKKWVDGATCWAASEVGSMEPSSVQSYSSCPMMCEVACTPEGLSDTADKCIIATGSMASDPVRTLGEINSNEVLTGYTMSVEVQVSDKTQEVAGHNRGKWINITVNVNEVGSVKVRWVPSKEEEASSVHQTMCKAERGAARDMGHGIVAAEAYCTCTKVVTIARCKEHSTSSHGLHQAQCFLESKNECDPPCITQQHPLLPSAKLSYCNSVTCVGEHILERLSNAAAKNETRMQDEVKEELAGHRDLMAGIMACIPVRTCGQIHSEKQLTYGNGTMCAEAYEVGSTEARVEESDEDTIMMFMGTHAPEGPSNASTVVDALTVSSQGGSLSRTVCTRSFQQVTIWRNRVKWRMVHEVDEDEAWTGVCDEGNKISKFEDEWAAQTKHSTAQPLTEIELNGLLVLYCAHVGFSSSERDETAVDNDRGEQIDGVTFTEICDLGNIMAQMETGYRMTQPVNVDGKMKLHILPDEASMLWPKRCAAMIRNSSKMIHQCSEGVVEERAEVAKEEEVISASGGNNECDLPWMHQWGLSPLSPREFSDAMEKNQNRLPAKMHQMDSQCSTMVEDDPRAVHQHIRSKAGVEACAIGAFEVQAKLMRAEVVSDVRSAMLKDGCGMGMKDVSRARVDMADACRVPPDASEERHAVWVFLLTGLGDGLCDSLLLLYSGGSLVSACDLANHILTEGWPCAVVTDCDPGQLVRELDAEEMTTTYEVRGVDSIMRTEEVGYEDDTASERGHKNECDSSYLIQKGPSSSSVQPFCDVPIISAWLPACARGQNEAENNATKQTNSKVGIGWPRTSSDNGMMNEESTRVARPVPHEPLEEAAHRLSSCSLSAGVVEGDSGELVGKIDAEELTVMRDVL
ncbi:uncharacterized protein LAESUDRAFT_715790 [Laetiporus sulphureus 93-53]|uniref:Uncharacterized protein n=1 Tax=Laetiporus sulphureus 93-53 TaxID=1314785 RepID=A0A165D313_9APHY|nr:uncharacterized protein LAESUDRAFT_715790 [Laetiporus sulphureus 93-53]KZT04058.1 hypothetical protein LAESUDRAFT_715790 [Laetiporus sulphureus 93-53]